MVSRSRALERGVRGKGKEERGGRPPEGRPAEARAARTREPFPPKHRCEPVPKGSAERRREAKRARSAPSGSEEPEMMMITPR